MDKTIATSINTIVKDIEALTVSLNTRKDSHKAWKEITEALHYLSAKDNMLEYEEKIKEEYID